MTVCNLGLSQDALMALAAELGQRLSLLRSRPPALVRDAAKSSPLCKANCPCGWWVVVANPGIHIGTAEAFGGL